MRADIELTEAGRQYAGAYEAHYERRSLGEALELYRAVMTAHPDSQEAGYARTQIQNIVKEVVPAGELFEAELGCALAHFEASEFSRARQSPVTPTRRGLSGRGEHHV